MLSSASTGPLGRIDIRTRRRILQPSNTAAYRAYLADVPPFAQTHGRIAVTTQRPLGVCLLRPEVMPRVIPENWRFRVVAMQCRLDDIVRSIRPGDEVSELPLDGFEHLWREDLLSVMRRRRPVAAALSVSVGDCVVAVEHLCLPFFRNGQISSLAGFFAADSLPEPVFAGGGRAPLAEARRRFRSRALELSWAHRVNGAGGEDCGFWRGVERLILESPTRPAARRRPGGGLNDARLGASPLS